MQQVNPYNKQGRGIKQGEYVAGDLRLSILTNVTAEDLGGFVKANVKKGSSLMTDSFRSYRPLQNDYVHHPTQAGRGLQAQHKLPIAHTLFSNFKAWANATFHWVMPKHLRRYQEEWIYRTNHRENLAHVFDYMLASAANNPTITHKQLVEDSAQQNAIVV